VLPAAAAGGWVPTSKVLVRPEQARGLVCHATVDKGEEGNKEPPSSRSPPRQLPEDDIDEGLIGSIGTWVLWAALIGYTLFLAPNQTPLRDSYFLEKLSGLGSDDGVSLNTILASLFLLERMFPLIYGALISPAAKNGNSLPAWPFLLSAVPFGSFALLPYFAMWEPSAEQIEVPPSPATMDPGLQLTESPLFAAALVAASGFLLAQISTAGGQQWYEFGRLFLESRLVHTAAVDVFTLTFALPFWIYTDADARGFKQQQLLPLLIVLPALGPALYLLLRPKVSAPARDA